MSFGSRAGLLSGCSMAQLYQMSITAGSNIPYWMWAGLPMFDFPKAETAAGGGAPLARAAGGVFIVDVAASMSLPPGVVPGQAIRMSLSIESSEFRNNTPEEVEGPQLQIIALTNGTLTNEGGSSLIQIGGIPGTDSSIYQEASEVEASQFAGMMRDGGYGGGSLMDWLRRLKPFLSKAVRAAPQIAAAIAPELVAPAGAVRDLAVSMGAGRHRGGKMVGGGVLAGHARR